MSAELDSALTMLARFATLGALLWAITSAASLFSVLLRILRYREEQKLLADSLRVLDALRKGPSDGDKS